MFLFFTKTSYLFTAKITSDVEEPRDSEKHLEPCKTSKMERFLKIVNKILPSFIFPKRCLTQFRICLCVCMLDAAFGF